LNPVSCRTVLKQTSPHRGAPLFRAGGLHNLDGFVKSPSAALRCILRHCGVSVSTHHSSEFARLASGAFYFAIPISTFYGFINLDPDIFLPRSLIFLIINWIPMNRNRNFGLCGIFEPVRPAGPSRVYILVLFHHRIRIRPSGRILFPAVLFPRVLFRRLWACAYPLSYLRVGFVLWFYKGPKRSVVVDAPSGSIR